MAPSNGTTYSSKVGRHPPPATIAHYNGTLQWHPAMAPRPLPQSWSSPSPPTIAHYNGTLRWRSNGTTSSAPCSGTLVPRPIRQSGSSPSPPIRSKNPYSYRYLGNKKQVAVKGYDMFRHWLPIANFGDRTKTNRFPWAPPKVNRIIDFSPYFKRLESVTYFLLLSFWFHTSTSRFFCYGHRKKPAAFSTISCEACNFFLSTSSRSAAWPQVEGKQKQRRCSMKACQLDTGLMVQKSCSI